MFKKIRSNPSLSSSDADALSQLEALFSVSTGTIDPTRDIDEKLLTIIGVIACSWKESDLFTVAFVLKQLLLHPQANSHFSSQGRLAAVERLLYLASSSSAKTSPQQQSKNLQMIAVCVATNLFAYQDGADAVLEDRELLQLCMSCCSQGLSSTTTSSAIVSVEESQASVMSVCAALQFNIAAALVAKQAEVPASDRKIHSQIEEDISNIVINIIATYSTTSLFAPQSSKSAQVMTCLARLLSTIETLLSQDCKSHESVKMLLLDNFDVDGLLDATDATVASKAASVAALLQ
jgi:hypothetical protein